MPSPTKPVNDADGDRRAVQATQRRVARIQRDGNIIVIRPVRCADVLSLLRTEQHVVRRDTIDRVRVVRTAELLFREGRFQNKRVLICPAGLEVVVTHLLELAGYEVSTKRPPRLRRARLVADGIDGPAPRDERLLEFVRDHDRGLILCDRPQADRTWIIAQIARALPRARIAIMATRQADIHDIGRRLASDLPEATCFTGRTVPAETGRIVISTYWQHGRPVAGYWERDIVVFLDAVEALGSVPKFVLGKAQGSPCLYGLIDRRKSIARRDADLVTAVFGLAEIAIPRPGYRDRPVEVLTHPIVAGPEIPWNADALTLKRYGLWRHPVRNRHVARIAAALAHGGVDLDNHRLQRAAEGLRRSSEARVAILVENVEHALALADLLREWEVLLHADTQSTHLPEPQARILSGRRLTGGAPGKRVIAILESLGALNVANLDVLIRADGGRAIPPALESGLVVSCRETSPLLLVDFADRHHPRLRCWWRSRREEYTARRWSIDGMAPPSMIEQFLVGRPKMTS